MSELIPAKRTRDDAGLLETQSRPSKRNATFSVATPQPEHREHRNPEGAVLDSLGELHLSTPPIETLPQELLLEVFKHLVHHSLVTAGFPEQYATHIRVDFDLKEDEPNEYGYVSAINRSDLRNLCLVSRKFKMAATTILYRCVHLATSKSPWSFLLTLRAHPDLRPLVKHVSVPTYGRRIDKRFTFAFVHDTYGWTSLRWAASFDLGAHFFAECGEYFSVGRLMLMVSLLPNLRTLIIPQTILLDGPFTKDLVLRNLKKLRINLMAKNEVIPHICSVSISNRTLTWLNPDFIGHRFPALQHLEISTPSGQWEADFVSEEVDTAEGGSPRKYVESLKTTTTYSMAPAEWDLRSLKQPIFHPSKLHTLKFHGPGNNCSWVSQTVGNWDLNRFFAEKGGGLRTLSLDWGVHDISADDDSDPQEVHFGPERRLTTLDKLANLTCLTVSLQALFGHAAKFWDWVGNIKATPDNELAKLLPPSLRTLRITEYIPGVFEDTWHISILDERERADMLAGIRHHNGCYFRFLQTLRIFWLLRAKDRELWTRSYVLLDLFESDSDTDMGRGRIARMVDQTAEEDDRFEEDGRFDAEDGFFELLKRPPEDAVWGP